MFSVEVVKNCPVSRASRGVITFDKDTISMIAGAVRDKIEWIVLLNGKRSDDGFEVTVEKITVPRQYRGGAHAEMTELDLAADVIGVMHSHHRMGAFFSPTDTNSLNPRFPSSVVVAVANNNLGFEYEAEGKVRLPCGSVGRVKFGLGVRGVDQRFEAKIVRAQHDIHLLGDCNDNYQTADAEYTRGVRTACGIELTVDRPMVFGKAGDGLLEVIGQQTLVRPKPVYPKYTGGYIGGGSSKYPAGKKRNGLVKLDRPDDNKRTVPSSFEQLAERNAQVGDKYTYKGGCDDCEVRGEMLRWHVDFESWLCRDCFKYADYIVQRAANEEAEDSGIGNGYCGGDYVRVTDQLEEMEEEGGSVTVLGEEVKVR